MVEMALAFPILLLVLVGTIEIGKYFNDYLTLLDATREGARYAADGDYAHAVEPPLVSNSCDDDVYRQAACLVIQNMHGIKFNPATDDIVVSAVSVGTDGQVKYRFPRACTDPVPPTGMYQLCNSNVSTSEHGWSYCKNVIQQGSPDPEVDNYRGPCQETASRISNAQIQADMGTSMPNSGMVIAEIYYTHHQFLGLIPPGLAFLPDQVRMYAYTIMPMPSAAPLTSP
jgi:hypothetical protein